MRRCAHATCFPHWGCGPCQALLCSLIAQHGPGWGCIVHVVECSCLLKDRVLYMRVRSGCLPAWALYAILQSFSGLPVAAHHGTGGRACNMRSQSLSFVMRQGPVCGVQPGLRPGHDLWPQDGWPDRIHPHEPAPHSQVSCLYTHLTDARLVNFQMGHCIRRMSQNLFTVCYLLIQVGVLPADGPRQPGGRAGGRMQQPTDMGVSTWRGQRWRALAGDWAGCGGIRITSSYDRYCLLTQSAVMSERGAKQCTVLSPTILDSACSTAHLSEEAMRQLIPSFAKVESRERYPSFVAPNVRSDSSVGLSQCFLKAQLWWYPLEG